MVEREVPEGGVTHHGLLPGQECPGCHRKLPHPKKESSPDTKTVSYRLPVDEADAHEEAWAAAGEYLGVDGQKFEKFKVLSLALALVLQEPSLKGFGANARP